MMKVSLASRTGIILVVCGATAIAAPGQTFTSLFSFAGSDGANPGGLIQATDGNFYSTTAAGGTGPCTSGCGTVFKITPSGMLTVLHSFAGTDGWHPDAGLVQATDGNFYGTTAAGGTVTSSCPDGCGTIFKVTPEGTLTTLHSFNGSDGAGPIAGLIQATDGSFYGTTFDLGANGDGTVFKITLEGTLTTLHSFAGTDGALPIAGLVQATDGNFYGTAAAGGTGPCSAGVGDGPAGCGTVFKITPSGTLTTLHKFDGTAADGSSPSAGLVQATDGNFYGTTFVGGDGGAGFGTVFKITPSGTLTTLHSFDRTDGALPYAGLVQATDGNFYGTTKYGTVFEIASSGTLTTLHKFDGTDGAVPEAGLVQATDGSFYGITSIGGADNDGTVFRFAVAPAVTLTATTLNFSNQALDESSAARKVILKNSGSALLNVDGVAIEGSNFAISANTCGGAVLAKDMTCNVSVTFTPAVLGNLTGTLTFTDIASNSPQVVALTGTGVEPTTLLPGNPNFGTWTVGTASTAKTFTLRNYQSVGLTSIAISMTGDFAVSTTTCTTNLAAKSTCTINVTFTPTATGTRSGKLSVSDSAHNSPQTSNLKGVGK